MSLHQEDYVNLGVNLLPVVIEAGKTIKNVMEREGMTIDEVITMLEGCRDKLPELDFGGEG